MAFKPSKRGNLFWLDIETNKIDENDGQMLEIAMVVTTPDASEIIGQFHRCIKIDFMRFEEWDDWCKETHTNNGLIEDCREHGSHLAIAESDALKFMEFTLARHQYTEGENELKKYYPPMCGSGIHFDRAWLKKHMPYLHKQFSYRNIDVSCFYECAARSERDLDSVNKNLPDYPHRAMGDIQRSIELFRRYKQQFNF